MNLHCIRHVYIAFAWALTGAISVCGAATPGVYPERIVFGQSAKLTGSGGTQLGRQYRDGALLAFNEANRKGGVHGRRIVLISMDDAIDAKRAQANTHALIEVEKVFALTHYTFTNPVKAALEISQAAQVPMIGPYTGYAALYAGSQPNLFVMRASFDDELSAIVRQIQTVGFSSVGFVYYANPLGEELLQDVERKLTGIDRKLSSAATMPLNASDPALAAAAAVAQLAGACPKVIILGVSGKDAAALIRGMHRTDCNNPKYFARSLVDVSGLTSELGPLARGVMVTQLVPNPHKGQHPLVTQYRHLLRQKDPSAVPDFVEFEGYIVARAIVRALEMGGRELDRNRFSAALRAIQFDGPKTYRLKFGPSGHVATRYVDLVMLAEGGRIAD